MTGPLAGKVAIVTGAAGVIGRAEALALAHAGAAVLVNDLRGAEDVAEAIGAEGGRAAVHTDNVAAPGAGERIVKAAMEAFGRLDIVINNAGIGRRAPLVQVTDADWSEVIAVNLTGAFALARATAPIFTAQRSGIIVNTSSEAGAGTYAFAAYAASKEGLIGLTRALAWELGRSGVTTFAIRPRAFDGARTPLDKLASFKSFEARAGVPMVGAHPYAHTIFPGAEEVGVAVAWLCAHAPSGLNGRVLQIGGGEIGLWREPYVNRSFKRDTPWDGAALDQIAEQLFDGLDDPRAQLSDALWSEMTDRRIRKTE